MIHHQILLQNQMLPEHRLSEVAAVGTLPEGVGHPADMLLGTEKHVGMFIIIIKCMYYINQDQKYNCFKVSKCSWL